MLDEDTLHLLVVFHGKPVKWFEVVVDLYHRVTLLELHVLDRGSNKVLVSINVKNWNSNGLINECLHDGYVKLTSLKAIKSNRCLALIEQKVAFILNFVRSHFGAILASLNEEVLILVNSSLS